MMNPQGVPSGPGASANPGGEMTPNTQPTMPIAQGPYRGPVMPGQGPSINSMFFFKFKSIVGNFLYILNLNFQISD